MTDRERDEWLKSLKVGDKVIVEPGTRGWVDGRYVDRVEKITPRGIITLKGDVSRESPRTFDVRGYERGKKDKWTSRTYLSQYSTEDVQSIMVSRYAAKLSNLRSDDLKKLGYATLKIAYDALFPKVERAELSKPEQAEEAKEAED